MSRAAIEERISDLRSKHADQIAQKYDLSLDGHWDIHAAKEDIRKNKGIFVQVLNKPFDKRWTYYTAKTSGFMARPRAPVMRAGLISNRILLTVRNPRRGNTDSFFVANTIVDKDGVSPFDNATVFPLFLPSADTEQSALLADNQLNLGNRFLTRLRATIGLPIGDGGLPSGVTPEDVFHYTYALFHSPNYRNRYAEFLKIDFPRLPLPTKVDLFRALARLGGELVALHLMESPTLDHFITSYAGPSEPEVERVGWSNSNVWIDSPATKRGQPAEPGTIGFCGVHEAVWNFHIGGYRVCEKWLKDRKGRTLSKDDIAHYQKIVVALTETIRLMKEIDDVIEKHGGWPGAFAQGDGAAEGAVTETEDTSNVVPLAHPKSMAVEYQTAPSQLLKAAEPEAPPYGTVAPTEVDAARPNPDELDREDLICRIRQLFGDGQKRERDTAIDVLVRELGYQRTGTRIHEELDNALRTAVRRGILASEPGAVRLFARTIEQYDRDFLKEQFLASLLGRQWIEREDAIRAFARWMGFRRTGPAIEDTARSLINGLLRECRLESGGSQIRRTMR
jgi:hypothetical protein